MRHLAILSIISVFTACSTAEPVDCFVLDEGECAKNAEDCHAITAAKYDEQQDCHTSEFAYCYPNDNGCTQQVTTALDPDGICWTFPSGCLLPDGWTDDSPDTELRQCPYRSEPACP